MSTGPQSESPSAKYEQWLLSSARADLARFYASATPLDAGLMDSLVLGRGALVVTTSASRANLPEEMRMHFERTADAVDHLFAHFREAVRRCPTFQSLGPDEQVRIEEAYFTPSPAAS